MALWSPLRIQLRTRHWQSRRSPTFVTKSRKESESSERSGSCSSVTTQIFSSWLIWSLPEAILHLRICMHFSSLLDAVTRYLVNEYVDTDLDRVINSHQPLTNDHLQLFMYQVCIPHSWRFLVIQRSLLPPLCWHHSSRPEAQQHSDHNRLYLEGRISSLLLTF